MLFEGTNVSVGRGTEKQFQIYGSPFYQKANLILALLHNLILVQRPCTQRKTMFWGRFNRN